MNHILHNISLIILALGIILMTVYITRASTNSFLTMKEQLLNKQAGLRRNYEPENIYDYKVSKAYRRMFKEPSIWMGYQEFDPDDKTEKLYI